MDISTFSVDVTPPVGMALCGGLIKSALGVRDPLFARGFVITGSGKPMVLVVFDWCELRNDGYRRVGQMIAESVGTTPDRVMVSTIHQHDTPIYDLYAENLLHEYGIDGLFCDTDVFEEQISRVALAAKEAINTALPLTHICTGQAKVEQIASNRRIPGTGVKIKAWRGSAIAANSDLKNDPEGLIDPYLKLIVFKSGDKSVAALNCYATHPMSYYGVRMVSADFVGDARAQLGMEHPETLVIYANGCGGNIAPGKYNVGNEESRQAMAARMTEAMRSAWASLDSRPVESVSVHSTKIDFRTLVPDNFTEEFFRSELATLPVDVDREYMENMRDNGTDDYMRYWNAAEGLSWLKSLEEDAAGMVSCLDFGSVKIAGLPGESFVQYQLAAQKLRPDAFVLVTAYGDCATGYIPVDCAWGEGGFEETASYAGPGVEMKMINALAELLDASPENYVPTQARELTAEEKRWPYKNEF